MKRIIGMGNRYRAEDAAGPLVCDYLRRTGLPPGVEAIDGGLGGLDLLRFLEGAERVVLADALADYSGPGRIAVFTAEEVESGAAEVYDHSAGPAYLLRAWRQAAEGPGPEVYVVGIAGPADPAVVEEAAGRCRLIATEGYAAAVERPGPAGGGPS